MMIMSIIIIIILIIIFFANFQYPDGKDEGSTGRMERQSSEWKVFDLFKAFDNIDIVKNILSGYAENQVYRVGVFRSMMSSIQFLIKEGYRKV